MKGLALWGTCLPILQDHRLQDALVDRHRQRQHLVLRAILLLILCDVLGRFPSILFSHLALLLF